ncbi:efflux transporter outer membrane subunit [Sphingomonas sp. BK580]|uniref:efflux transporter outer membrane subunit n=1 Tax=Sphingomonas sp. BK580 TaxID=2586972 RepID=UPI0016200810|nr:efflux transporter outer membrane subunit [Sphingomonas sp. BK580]MBB3695158.1 NodT family efflux transporter outer membrane factor (OMF) lipoprotein [Sphingomonas sp. BK580]
MKPALPLLSAALLSGCAGPRPETPLSAAVVAPAAWRDGAAAGGRLDPAWWNRFGEPALTAIVARALDRNLDVAIAATRVEEARAQFAAARGAQLPSASASASGARERTVNAFGEGADQTAGQVQLSVSYDADLFGRLRNATAAARADLLATRAGRDGVRLAVAASAAGGYVALLALDARLEVLRATLDARRASLRLAQRRTEAGYSASLELAQAEGDFRATEQQIPITELAIRRQENGLSVLTGDEPASVARGRPLGELALPVVEATVPADLLRARPDVVQAEEQVVAADQRLDAARAAFLPSLQLGATGGIALSTLLRSPIDVFQLGGSILAPLFQGGRLRAQSDAAAARRDQAAFAYRRTVLDAFREVEDALAEQKRYAEQEAALTKQRAAVATALRHAINRFDAGYSPYLEQLDAQRSLLSADLALVQARSDRLSAAVRLFQALGGGLGA